MRKYKRNKNIKNKTLKRNNNDEPMLIMSKPNPMKSKSSPSSSGGEGEEKWTPDKTEDSESNSKRIYNLRKNDLKSKPFKSKKDPKKRSAHRNQIRKHGKHPMKKNSKKHYKKKSEHRCCSCGAILFQTYWF